MLRLYHFFNMRTVRRHFPIIFFGLVIFLFIVSLDERDVGLVARDSRLKLTMQFEQAGRGKEVEPVHHATDPSPLTVHLVVAATVTEDISWAFEIKIPSFKVIHYVADDPSWPNHPPANRGREAMIYHTYFHDFYDELPDIVILTHAHDVSWHMESLFNHSLTYAITHLDISAVKERGYANLRVSWENACPAYINTTLRGTEGIEGEGQSTHEAFLGNFGDPSGLTGDVPEILAQPCCSQFAVTRDVIRSVPRTQYARSINWLVNSPMSDFILGRTWEHMFQWLFAKKAVDCPIEWKTYCKMYHICFDGVEEYEKYMDLDHQRADLIDKYDVSFFKALLFWCVGSGRQGLVREINVISRQIDELVKRAQERGSEEKVRAISVESLYLEQ